MVETSLISSAVLLEDTSRLDGFTEEDRGKFIDIPLEGGLLKIEVCKFVMSDSSRFTHRHYPLHDIIIT